MLTAAEDVQSLAALRVASNGDYIVRHTSCRFGDRAFSVAAPRASNRLLADLKTVSCSTDVFKRRLETFLFNSVYGDWQTTLSSRIVMRHRSICYWGRITTCRHLTFRQRLISCTCRLRGVDALNVVILPGLVQPVFERIDEGAFTTRCSTVARSSGVDIRGV